MKKLIIANIKANQTFEQAKNYFTKIVSGYVNQNTNLIVCPAYTYLTLSNFFIKGTNIKLGAQNISESENEYIAGEIPASVLKSVGVDYVIVDHPTRKEKFRESNLLVNKKIKSALGQGLKCILYVGESFAEKKSLKTVEVLKKQLDECLKGLYENELESIIVVYEPLWAAKREENISIKDVENGAKIIRKVINDNYSEKAGRDIVVAYGGGLDELNYQKMLCAKGIDGGVFARSAENVESFLNMINKLK